MTEPNITSIIGYIVGVVGAITVIFSNTRKDNEKIKDANIKDLRERVEILEKERIEYKQMLVDEREQSREQHVQNQKAIAALEKEVAIYKDLQLSSIAETNKQILETLRSSAITLASGTKDRAERVETVKTDLESK